MIQNISAMTILIAETTTILYQQWKQNDPPIESARIKLTTKQPKTTRKQNDSKHLSYDNIDS